MKARAALFDLYGDHLRSRGGAAPVAGLIRALGTLGIAPPAVRTAISRMAREGWLERTRTGSAAAYVLSDRAVRRLDEAAARIYRTRDEAWDGNWHLLVVDRVHDRSARERLRVGLRYLGYGAIDDTTWIAARPSTELDGLLRTEHVEANRFLARHDDDTRALVRRVWDLDGLDSSYREWLDAARGIVGAVGPATPIDRAFAARSQLVHEWRKFLFTDPALPADLLPRDWSARTAARYFDTHAQRLLPAATRFVSECVITDGDGNE